MNDHEPAVPPSRNGHTRVIPPVSAPAAEQDSAAGDGTERRGASRSEAPRSAGPSPASAPSPVPPPPPPNPEAEERPRRRTFTAEYKLAIVREADACAPGEVGALLRREGLYSSHLTEWRRQREAGELEALTPKKRGRKPRFSPLELENARLRRENAALQEQLRKAELIMAAQKKVAQILEEFSIKPAKDEPPGRGS